MQHITIFLLLFTILPSSSKEEIDKQTHRKGGPPSDELFFKAISKGGRIKEDPVNGETIKGGPTQEEPTKWSSKGSSSYADPINMNSKGNATQKNPSKGGSSPEADRTKGNHTRGDPKTKSSGEGNASHVEEEMPTHEEEKHLRPSEMGIPVGEALDPPLCPPPPVTRSLGICYLRKCSTYHDCDREEACCFNGCIHTCMEPLQRPAAFDWIEDTSKVLPILGLDFDEHLPVFHPILLQPQSPEYAAAEGGEELVHLPGGCYVSASRYQKLKEFMKAPSIKECRCADGEVVCDVRTERT